MSPRKSSTSSGKAASSRPRYLALEVAGDQPLSPRSLERELARLLDDPTVEVRVIRMEGGRALVRIPHTIVPKARLRWNRSEGDAAVPYRTIRSYGTLRKGKVWIRRPL